MLKSALILGAALAAAGSASSDSPRNARRDAFVLFSGGIPTVQINTGRGAVCRFEAPMRAKRGKPMFAAY